MGHPTLLLLTDNIPAANGAGMRQTLYNLLEDYPATMLLLAFPEEITNKEGEELLNVKLLLQPSGPFRPWTNRFGAWVNTWLHPFQLSWLAGVTIKPVGLPQPENCLVLVSTGSVQKLMLAWQLKQQGYTVIPYFMDDWMAGSHLQWKGQNLQELVQQLLQQAPAWLMISQPLEQILRKRYHLLPKPCLIIHNPAPKIQLSTSNLQFAGATTSRLLQTANCKLPQPHCHLPTASRQLIYAGSIWPMHADALISIAQAIHRLQVQGHTSYSLTIFTSEAHWAQYRLQLIGPGVQYAGWKPYHEVHAQLQEGWLLVCTASFAEAHQAYSRSSIQTKLTDYMAAGKPILFVGPADSASGIFTETWDCGFTIGTPNTNDIAERLQAIARMQEQYHRKAENALLHSTSTFSKDVVQENLYAFLKNIKPVVSSYEANKINA